MGRAAAAPACVLATADGRGGPGVDARALADAVLAGVDEDFVAELALARGCTEAEASTVLREALLLTGPLAPTWCRLNAGLLGGAARQGRRRPARRRHPRGRRRGAGPGAAAVGGADRDGVPGPDPLPPVPGRRRGQGNAAAARRCAGSACSPAASTRASPSWSSRAPPRRCTPPRTRSTSYARFRRADGDTRPIGVLRAETGLDLILRPWDTTRPPVTGQLVIHASARTLRPDGDPDQTQTPAESTGSVVSAAECRDLLTELDCSLGDRRPAGRSCRRRRPGHRRDHRRRHPPRTRDAPPRGAGPAAAARTPPPTNPPPPRNASSRSATGTAACPAAADAPGRSTSTTSSPTTCGGPTACWNLCCLCRRHHRIKTFAPGWSFRLLADGTLDVRTPAGITRTTRPPGWCPDPEPDPPWLDEQAPPDPMRC